MLLLTGCNRWDEGLDVVAEGDAVQVTDEALLTRLAQAWARKWDGQWQFEVRDGRFEHPGGGPAQVFEVRPAKVLAFAKGQLRPDPAPPRLVPWPPGGHMDTLLPGIYAERVPTSRLTVNVLAVAGHDDPARPCCSCTATCRPRCSGSR